MATAPPRVKLITIDGLFRQYDHRIPLHLDERVTVLHGRNGVGKTVTLSLVAALLQGDYAGLVKVPFDQLRLDFTDGSFLSIRSSNKGRGRRGAKKSELTDRAGESRKLWIEYQLDGDGAVLAGEWLDPWGTRSLFGDLDQEPAVVGQLRGRHSVHFIEAQRLFKVVSDQQSSEPDAGPAATSATRDTFKGSLTRFEAWAAARRSTVTSAMADIAEEMAGRIQEADSTYRSTSTRLDDSLPARLFAPPGNGSTLSKKELARRTEALEVERRRLHEIGLLPDTTSFNPDKLDETQRAMFAVYLKDNEEKLAVFGNLAARAELLLGTLNRKLAPKQIKLDKDEGYRVTSHDGRPLALDHLSSGEQHELVLLHDLLFRVEPGALLLIDEPELSLHVTWQSEFLAELIQIAKKVGFDAVVATHSPYIVGERRDLMVRLGEPV